MLQTNIKYLIWILGFLFVPALLFVQSKILLFMHCENVLTHDKFYQNRSQHLERQEITTEERPQTQCAINLLGLPRAFKSLVLPSLIRNVIQTNAAYECDYFIHFYDLKQEAPGRSGRGGQVNPEDILLLEKAVHEITPNAVVRFVNDTEAEFWEKHNPLVEKVKTTFDDEGKPVYFPWRAGNFEFPLTVVNIFKMWYSCQRAWNLMEEYQQSRRTTKYSRVAMLRSDVVFMTQVDIYTNHTDVRDDKNEYVVVPAFAKYPVNDRLIYGPADAVKIWATGRFSRMEEHAQKCLKSRRGWALHPEQFVAFELFPAIRNVTGVREIVEHDSICFFRARPDESVWIRDCAASAEPSVMEHLGNNTKSSVEVVLGRKCGDIVAMDYAGLALLCPNNENVTSD